MHVNTEKRPICPRCNKVFLERLISRFSVLRGAKEKDDIGMPDLDESKLQKSISLLKREVKDINEDDPKQAAYLLRKLVETTGLDFGSGIEEVLSRMEAGENSDKIEKEMGDIFNEEDLFKATLKTPRKVKKKSPERDETLYYL
jgi:hypothetical protein